MRKILSSLIVALALVMAFVFVYDATKDSRSENKTVVSVKAKPSPVASTPDAVQSFRANVAPASFHFSDWQSNKIPAENPFTDYSFDPRLTYQLKPLDRPPGNLARDNPTRNFNEIVFENHFSKRE